MIDDVETRTRDVEVMLLSLSTSYSPERALLHRAFMYSNCRRFPLGIALDS